MGAANLTEVQSVHFKRSPAGIAWRWRSELGLVSGGLAGFFECWHLVGLVLTAVTLGGGALLGAVLPWSHRFAVRRFWSLVSRHRLQQVWWQLRLHNRAGRLPLVLWIRPTPVGERARVVCRAGLCADDFINAAPEMAAACAAREVRVTASPRYSLLLTIDVIRRDPLAPGKLVPSLLAEHAPVLVAEPVPAALGWPGIALGDE